MNSSPAQKNYVADVLAGGEPEKRATVLFLAWVLLLLLVDLCTLHVFPVPWNDEVMFADPAASLVLHGHWSSTAWYGRGDMQYWTGNAPGYSFLLVPWIWLWGFGAAAVRSLNSVLIAFTLVAGWFAVKRMRWIPAPGIRLAVLVALSLCYPVSFCVRVGRPDVLGMLLFALAALAWTAPKKPLAWGGLFGCALCLPFAGLHYAFYLPLLLGMIAWSGGRRTWPRLGMVILGGTAGAALFWAYHQYVAGWNGLLANMSDIRIRRPSGLWENIRMLVGDQLFVYYFQRPHFLILMVLAAWLGFIRRQLGPEGRRAWLQGCGLLVFTGLLVGIGSQFRAPYHWLAVVPAVILFASAVVGSWDALGVGTKRLCVVLLLGLALSGRLLFIGAGGWFHTAGYTAQIEKSAAALVAPGETVYADWQVYYALKPRAGTLYWSHLVPRLTPAEKAAVSVAFIHPQGQYEPHDVQWLGDTFGGCWMPVAELADPRAGLNPGLLRWLDRFNPECFTGTRLSVYRRVPTNLLITRPAAPHPAPVASSPVQSPRPPAPLKPVNPKASR